MRKDVFERMKLMQKEEIEPNYAELARRYECDYRTVKPAFCHSLYSLLVLFYATILAVMVLYVDETECPEYFIVTGLLVNSKQDVELAFKRFKKWTLNIPLPEDVRAQLNTEYKSTLLDRRYKRIKIAMLTELNKFNESIIYSCYVKKDIHFSQKEKERAYINLISKIVSSIEVRIEICFDRFNISSFEANIVKKLLSFPNVSNAEPADSQKEAGLKFTDNLCSVMRLHKTCSDESHFYDIIKEKVFEV